MRGLHALLSLSLWSASFISAQDNNTTVTETIAGDDDNPTLIALFPLFLIVVGSVVYLLTSRFFPKVPHTAVVFLIGTAIGVAVELWDSNDKLTDSVNEWIRIDSGVVLLVFLPGLLYKDALDLNFHVLQHTFWQCVLFAFPMVLAQAALIALVFHNYFPFDWSFDFSMTMGCVLAATDPVTIQLLLQQAGAPPRLQTHIGGEALFNDASVVVLYSIFEARYLTDFRIDNIGTSLGLADSIEYYCRQFLGGIAMGIAFGLGLMAFLKVLNRRLDETENCIQVALSFAAAFLCFFVSEDIAGVSGVVADVALAVTTEFFGKHLFGNRTLLEQFWHIIDGAEDTIIFALGGVFFGVTMTNDQTRFRAKHWGFLILLYVVTTLARLIVFVGFFPITSKMRGGSDWREMVFQSWAAMRGELAIALTISLVNVVVSNSEVETGPFIKQTRTLFGFVAGTVFLTQIINGTTAPYLLRLLGLDDSVKVRQQMLDIYKDQYRPDAIEDMVQLLAQRRFSRVNYAVIRFHVPMLRKLKETELMDAARRFRRGREDVDTSSRPRLQHILPYLEIDDSKFDFEVNEQTDIMAESMENIDLRQALAAPDYSFRKAKSFRRNKSVDIKSVEEVRRLFLELLKLAYEDQIQSGELRKREYLAESLKQSLDFSALEVFKGGKLNDWDYVNLLERPIGEAVESFIHQTNDERNRKRLDVERSMAFIYAHKSAQTDLKEVIPESSNLVRKMVLAESQEQMDKAIEMLSTLTKEDLQHFVSHKFCKILLTRAIHHVEYLAEADLLKSQQSHTFLMELETSYRQVDQCCLVARHPGELPMDENNANGSSIQRRPVAKYHNSVDRLLLAEPSENAEPSDNIGTENTTDIVFVPTLPSIEAVKKNLDKSEDFA